MCHSGCIAAKVHVFAVMESGLDWIVRDIVSKFTEMFSGPHQMIEALVLPEMPFFPKHTIDVHGRVSLPAFALPLQPHARMKLHQYVNVIGHDDEISQVVTLSIKLVQALLDNAGQLTALENALTVSFVEKVVPLRCNHAMEIVAQGLRQSRQSPLPARAARINAMTHQPTVT